VRKILSEYEKNDSCIDEDKEVPLDVKNGRFLFSMALKNEINAYPR